MRVLILGAGGFIGHHLAGYLKENEFDILLSGRKDFELGLVEDKIADCDIVINLLGRGISGIWTRARKKSIYDSRVLSTRRLVKWINEKENHIKLVIQVSGVGIYDGEHNHDESSVLFAKGFLSEVIVDWEGELLRIGKKAIRITILRLGVVLGKEGGILKVIIKPFRWGLCYSINSFYGFPFIHLKDLLQIFKLVISDESLRGIINVVSPEAVSIDRFYTEMAESHHRKILFKINPAMVRLFMGESSVLITEGQRVIPKKLMDLGFDFKYGCITEALHEIIDL